MPPKRIASDLMFGSALRRVMAHSRIYPFLERGSLDVVQMLPGGDDFMGDTLRTDIYTVSNGGGASAASPVITAGVLNGVCDFVTGTANDSTASSELSTGLQFRGDHGCVMVACLQVDIITGVKIEVGFTDSLTDPGAVGTKATPTFTAEDCALWVLDTNDNTDWEGLAANNTSTAPMTTVEAAIQPTASTYEWLMVELIENDDQQPVRGGLQPVQRGRAAHLPPDRRSCRQPGAELQRPADAVDLHRGEERHKQDTAPRLLERLAIQEPTVLITNGKEIGKNPHYNYVEDACTRCGAVRWVQSRIRTLEQRVTLLEAENAALRSSVDRSGVSNVT